MPLLPNCPSQWYNSWVTNNANEEGFVNGLWNAILSSMYNTSTLEFTINPEVYVQPGRIDLLVTHNEVQGGNPIGVWQIIYEGKGGLSNDGFPQILAQLQGYAANLVHNRNVYLIGGRGGQAKFWFYTMNGAGIPTTQGISVGVGMNIDFAQDATATQYDMILQQGEIGAILTYFVNNQPQA